MHNAILCEPSAPRILLDSVALTDGLPGEPPQIPAKAASDLQHVEELLERCWRELDTVDLNVKLTDLIRLLEFKHKLGPGQQAERAFWELIDEIRRDELHNYGDLRQLPNTGRESEDS